MLDLSRCSRPVQLAFLAAFIVVGRTVPKILAWQFPALAPWQDTLFMLTVLVLAGICGMFVRRRLVGLVAMSGLVALFGTIDYLHLSKASSLVMYVTWILLASWSVGWTLYLYRSGDSKPGPPLEERPITLFDNRR